MEASLTSSLHTFTGTSELSFFRSSTCTLWSNRSTTYILLSCPKGYQIEIFSKLNRGMSTYTLFLWLCASYLLFVWRDVDAICHEITLRDHFHFFGTVVHNVSPGLRQKNLHKRFHEITAEVVVVGCVEGIRRHGDDVIHTAKSRPDWMRPLTHTKKQKPILPSQRTCEGVRAWRFSNGAVRGSPPWTGTSPPDSDVAGDWQQAGKFLLKEKNVKYKYIFNLTKILHGLSKTLECGWSDPIVVDAKSFQVQHNISLWHFLCIFNNVTSSGPYSSPLLHMQVVAPKIHWQWKRVKESNERRIRILISQVEICVSCVWR